MTARTTRLLQLCALLSGRPSRHPPREGAWPGVLDLAREQLLLPALHVALRRAGPVTTTAPAPADRVLRQAYRRNLARNVALRRQLEHAVTALNQAGIEPLLFKGALLLYDGTFPDPGERAQWDLDLAVQPQQLPEARVALESIGYRAKSTRPFAHPHELPLVHEVEAADLELHGKLGSRPLPELLPLSRALATATPVPVGGARALALAPTAAVIHNVAHAQIQDLNHACAGIALRQLHTLGRMLDTHREQIDWEEVERAFSAVDAGHVLAAYLHQAHALLGASVPSGTAGGARAGAHHLLCLAAWQLGWPTDVVRNLRFAFGREYLLATYPGAERPLRLAAVRGRHAVALIRRRGTGVIAEARRRRV